jgi:hypothetical protein
MRQIESGMWVSCDQGIGIFIIESVAVKQDGTMRKTGGLHASIQPDESLHRLPWVHLINADGSTLAEIPADRCANIKQAPLTSIPQARIEHLNSEQLAALGYQ